MSKILLAAVNAQYNHTNIAVRSLALYSNHPELVEFDEWTINQPVLEILRGIASHNPEIILFSTYIWNSEIIQKIIPDIKKILPDCIIAAGGPEAGFCAEKLLNKLSALDFIVYGEGEETFRHIVEKYSKSENLTAFKALLPEIKGIYVRTKDGPKPTEGRELLCNLDELPFPYPEITDPDNKIYYYESSRGCPFSCAYCMSSLDKRVRFLSLERVFTDIQRFLDANTKLVKFVDRTYNLKEDRYIAIWQYILDHHNGKTMFHFEIEAEFLSENALNFLKKVPDGVMQFEIGVQSANKKTLKAVGRSDNIETLAKNILRIPPSIHCHLDLIAGLPFENLESFGNSFDFVMDLNPTELQLGFLKVLHGTTMESYCKENNWQWMENPPYETLSTPYMNYNDLLFLKDIEVLNDAFWNSRHFETSMVYAKRKYGMWNLFCKLLEKARDKKVFESPKKELFWFEFLMNFFQDLSDSVMTELIRFDFIKTGKKGGFPDWYTHNYDKDEHRNALEKFGGVTNARLDFAYSDYEKFAVDPFSTEPEKTNGTFNVLFLYQRRDSNRKASQILVD